MKNQKRGVQSIQKHECKRTRSFFCLKNESTIIICLNTPSLGTFPFKWQTLVSFHWIFHSRRLEAWTSYSYLQGTCADVIRHLFGSWETWLAEKSLSHYKMSQSLWCLKFFFLKKCIYFNLHLDEVYSSRWQEFQSICKKRQAF